MVIPFVLLLATWQTATGHQLDEYLQATLIDISPDEVRLYVNLTPGVEIADHVIDHIDSNADGKISGDEANSYATAFPKVLNATLDGKKLALQVEEFQVPEMAELETGWGVIQIELSASLPILASGEHHLQFSNHHEQHLSSYLLNAAMPRSDAIRIIRQERNHNQSDGRIIFSYEAPQSGNAAYAFSLGMVAMFVVLGLAITRLKRKV
ncbi:hypothetical protein C5Y93_31390 [Blastopirellula marina]|uniref:EF-hand domain-containing protein n=1 Tax=Blastopirellula marina TaxID=124 RepID=A0A2S8GAX5_9BACT|nr:hypothetical protein C5Y93_31390 [Blastopirellula marina]